jgi:hypothetical protein
MFQKKLLFSIILIFVIISCTQTSSEQQISSQITKMQDALIDKSLPDFMQFFSSDFMGNNKISRGELRQLIFFHFQRNRSIQSYKWQADISVIGQLAEVELYIILSGSNKNLPERGKVYTIKSSWIKIKDNWIINSANWKDINFRF